MLSYDYPLYRPPSEAYSLILQVTLGCSHNACTFCTMYKNKKYRQKTWAEICSMIEISAQKYPQTRKIFLADGDALSLPTETLLNTLELLFRSFSSLERVSIYAGPKDALEKSVEELSALRKTGLSLVFLGVESGSDQILSDIKKGVDAKDMILAGQKIKLSGLQLSATLISGLGGLEMWEDHARDSARVISAIKPDYLATLTLVLEEGAPMLSRLHSGSLKMLTPWEVLRETRLFIEHLELSGTIYRSNHASNYFRLAAVLNEQREELLRSIDKHLGDPLLRSLPADNSRPL